LDLAVTMSGADVEAGGPDDLRRFTSAPTVVVRR
jgi:hypothetical protein